MLGVVDETEADRTASASRLAPAAPLLHLMKAKIEFSLGAILHHRLLTFLASLSLLEINSSPPLT